MININYEKVYTTKNYGNYKIINNTKFRLYE